MTVDGLHPTLALALTKCPKYPCGFDAMPSNLKYCGASCCVPPLSSLHDLPTSRVFLGAVWLAGLTVVVRMLVQRKHELLDKNPETKHCWGNDFSTHKKPNMVDPPITMNSWWCGAKAVSLQCWGSQQLQEGIPTLIRHLLWRMEAWMESHVHICHIVWWKQLRQGNAHADPMSIDMFCCHGSVRGQHCCSSMRYFAVGYLSSHWFAALFSRGRFAMIWEVPHKGLAPTRVSLASFAVHVSSVMTCTAHFLQFLGVSLVWLILLEQLEKKNIETPGSFSSALETIT
jgi:hypothetical protein